MKILFFNLNKGKNNFNGIIEFLRNQKDLDILCFQEIEDEIKKRIESELFEFKFKSYSKEIDEFGYFNLETFVRKDYQKITFEILEDNREIKAPAIFVEIESGNSKYNILNFHGTFLPANKLDTEIRIEASQNLVSFMNKKEGIKIIGGDFNLLPETKSIKIFEEVGFKNLIKEFNIPTTRNENAWRLYPDNKQLFADYVFISRNSQIKKFEVIQNEISDHLPLILEI